MAFDITFAKTRYHYDSYNDFWSLVNLSGFPTCYVDEIDFFSDRIYIMSPMNGEWIPNMDDKINPANRAFRKAKLVQWNLERPGSSLDEYASGQHKLIDTGYFDATFVSDRQLAAASELTYCIMGGHQGLGFPGPFESKRYDVIHLSCYSTRRAFLFEHPSKPRDRFVGYSVAPNGWGELRAYNLMRSKYMLNIHQDDWHYIEPLRLTLAACYGLPVIGEIAYDYFPYEQWVLPWADFKRHLDNYNRSVYDMGLVFRSHMTQSNNFAYCVRDACARLWG